MANYNTRKLNSMRRMTAFRIKEVFEAEEDDIKELMQRLSKHKPTKKQVDLITQLRSLLFGVSNIKNIYIQRTSTITKSRIPPNPYEQDIIKLTNIINKYLK